ncbi:MAG: hypothetical protein ACYC35_29090 [Pirellulales bacterium]
MAPAILPETTAVLYRRTSSRKQGKTVAAQRQELVAYSATRGVGDPGECVGLAISGNSDR